MGFFTDSDKKEENIDQGFFQNPGQSVAENNFFISRQGSSLSKVCRTDPKDNKFMICNIKEKKLRNENGQDKYVTEEREEREPASSHGIFNLFGSSNNFASQNFENNFFGNPKTKNNEDVAFKEFEESQHFMDFIPRIRNFFKGRSNYQNSDDDKLNYDKKPQNSREESDHDPFVDMRLFPLLIFRDFGFPNLEGFNNDIFFNHNFNEENRTRNGFHPTNFYNTTPNNFEKKTENSFQKNNYNGNNRNYAYPNYRPSKTNTDDDIYDL